MKQNETTKFVDSIFDERIWQMDVDFQKEMVRLWIALAYEEGKKVGARCCVPVRGKHRISNFE